MQWSKEKHTANFPIVKLIKYYKNLHISYEELMADLVFINHTFMSAN